MKEFKYFIREYSDQRGGVYPLIGKRWTDEERAEIKTLLEGAGLRLVDGGVGWIVITEKRNEHGHYRLRNEILQALPQAKAKWEIERDRKREADRIKEEQEKLRREQFAKENAGVFAMLDHWFDNSFTYVAKEQIALVYAGKLKAKKAYIYANNTMIDRIVAKLKQWGVADEIQDTQVFIPFIVEKLKAVQV